MKTLTRKKIFQTTIVRQKEQKITFLKSERHQKHNFFREKEKGIQTLQTLQH